MQKLETEATITRMGREGDGIAMIDGKPIFVAYTVPGDVAEISLSSTDKSSNANQGFEKTSHADLKAINKPSAQRKKPECQLFGACGGCSLQNWQDKPYQDWKRNLLKTSMMQAGLSEFEADKKLAPLFSVEPASRRRLILSASLAKGQIALGFNRTRSHEIIKIEECPVAKPSLVAAIPLLRKLLTVLNARRKSFHIVLTEAENGLDIALQDIEDLTEEEKLRLSKFIITEKQKVNSPLATIAAQILRITANEEIILETEKPFLYFGSVRVEIPSGGFLQAVAQAEDFMVQTAQKALRKSKHVVDLFAGSGSFTFRLASQSNVHAVEWDKAALQALMQAKTDIASVQAAGDEATPVKLKKITSERRDLFQQPLTYKELADFDGLIFDPPRAGAALQAEEIAKAQIKTVVAVSCNPTSFARDLQILLKGGYQLQSLIPIDQFLWSSHVEAVAILTKRPPKKRWSL